MSTSTAAAQPPPGAETGRPPARLGLALVVIATAQLMVVLDASIVNIALPSIQDDLAFSAANLTWVVNGYTLAFGGLLLLGGRAGDLFGRRRVFVFGILLFTLASLLGGFANGETTLIAARVLQGAGAAVASPTALSLITTTFPEGTARNRAMAVYAAMSGAGAAVGLIAGGMLTDYLSWEWTLWVNVPIGVLVAFLAPRVLSESSRGHGRIDVAGALLGTLGITALVYGIIRSSEESFTEELALLSYAVAALALVVFLLVEARHREPIMPLRLFRDRNRSGSYAAMLFVGAGLFAMFYFLGLFVQQVLGYSPVRAGVAFLPFTVGIVVSAGIASQLVTRVPPRVLSGIGLAMGAAGLLGYSRLTVDASYFPDLLVPMVVTSLGMGFAFVPLTLAAVSGTGQRDAGIASALLNTAQQVGGSLGLAVLASVATGRADDLLPDADAAFFQGLATGNLALVQRANAALTEGYTTAFVVGAGMIATGLVIVLAAVNARRQRVDADGAASVHVG